MKKLNLGCGDKPIEGYFNVDGYQYIGVDLIDDVIYLSKLAGQENTFDEIYMNAVYEHIDEKRRKFALRRWNELLVSGGKLVIHSIPDFERIAKAYINKEKSFLHEGVFDTRDAFGWIYGPDINDPYLRHRDIFDKEKLRKEFESAGFVVHEIKNVCWGNEPIDLNLNAVLLKK